MKMRKAVFVILMFALTSAIADEGMWQPHQLPQIAKQLKAAGLKINPSHLTDLTGFPMGAIVSLGGCTASFVSDRGLIITNHHCVYGDLQYNSTKDNNILENGFLARSLDEELPAAPGSRVYVTEKISNVTDRITAGLTDAMGGTEREQYVDRASKELVADCEADDKYRCSVVNFHGGLEYYLFKQLMIRDVRLVHAPAKSIGKYGGDIDNWMWPRHTGDYGFLRAYVGKDGQPADYSEDNVPYEPEHHLKVNASGVADGDYLMVLGYPGRTNRYRTAEEVAYTFNESYPLGKEIRGALMAVIQDVTANDDAARIKYENTFASLANYEKNYGSMIESYNKGTTQARKDKLGKDLREWVKGSPERQARFGDAIEALDRLVAIDNANGKRDTIRFYTSYYSLLYYSEVLYRLAIEKQKPDLERESGYQQRDIQKIEQAMKRLSRRYEASVDKAMLAYMLQQYSTLQDTQRMPSFDRFFGLEDGYSESRLAERLDAMYAGTDLDDEAERLAWMNRSVDEFEASEDPFIRYAVATWSDRKQLEDADRELSGQFQAVRPKFMEAIIAFNREQGQPIYADANSTLRITYGNVKGYSPRDGIFAVPFTRLEGITEKDTGAEPFNSPKGQLELIEKRTYGDYYVKAIDSVPVNFLGTLDITGGNSGSPTLNAKAELVGLVFDGVYESVIGDWDYDPKLNRSIHVDARYMLWVMQYLDGAENLLKEMDIVR